MADRENVDLWFGDPRFDAPDEEEGRRRRIYGPSRFLVQVIYLDGVERPLDRFDWLREALEARDRERAELAAAGYDRTRAHVRVVDVDDGERGSLEWDDLEEDE
jgi:hypothetical protein